MILIIKKTSGQAESGNRQVQKLHQETSRVCAGVGPVGNDACAIQERADGRRACGVPKGKECEGAVSPAKNQSI